jgi:hypothetical protein
MGGETRKMESAVSRNDRKQQDARSPIFFLGQRGDARLTRAVVPGAEVVTARAPGVPACLRGREVILCGGLELLLGMPTGGWQPLANNVRTLTLLCAPQEADSLPAVEAALADTGLTGKCRLQPVSGGYLRAIQRTSLPGFGRNRRSVPARTGAPVPEATYGLLAARRPAWV